MQKDKVAWKSSWETSCGCNDKGNTMAIRVAYSGMIAKTKVVEKVKAVLFIEFLKVTGFG